MRTALTSSLVLACLACGGPVDVAGAFSGLCSAEVTPSVDLPRVGADLPRPKLAVHLVVGPHGTSLDGEPLADRTTALARLELELSRAAPDEPLSLLPFVPASIGFSWQKAVRGNNAIVFDNYFQITVQAFAPLYKLWTKE